jgi:hypothetical protein
MTAIFKLTNGTQSVDLLGLAEGVSLDTWRQAVAQYKSGGTFQQSSLADGRRLVDKRFAEIRETLQIKIGAGVAITQDVSIGILHELFALMECASNYWVSDWSNAPVWLESKASCETNTRYALVVTANFVDLDNIYGDPFYSNAAFANLTMVIERGHWLDNEPGSATATEISAVETYSGVNYGNVDDSEVREPVTSGVYLTNMRGVENITHVFTWSAANGWSANLLGGPFPYDLIDVAGAAPAINDLLYFGIEFNAPAAPGQELRSLVLDIGTAQTGISLVWEYYWGGAWLPLPSVQDNTAVGGQPLDTTGVNSIHWVIPTAVPSSLVIVNGITAQWIRARVTAVPGPVVAPTQQNRNPYMIDWPYTEIQSDKIAGDIDSLARIKLVVESQDGASVTGVEDLFYSRVIMGLRSMSRGANFTAYLNADDDAVANPAGITFSCAGGVFTIASVPSISPVTQAGAFGAGVTAPTDAYTWTLDTSIAAEYYGTFRAYAVFRGTTTFGNVVTRLKIKLGAGGETISSPAQISPGTTFEFLLMEYGKITIPQPGILTTDDPMTVELIINIELVGAGASGYLIDLVLIPVDEWAIDTQDTVNDGDSTIEEGRYLDIDSVINPKTPLRSLARTVATDEVTGIYLAVKNGPAILHPNSRQRLWALMCAPLSPGSTTWVADIRTCASIQIEKVQRYLGPRGTQ